MALLKHTITNLVSIFQPPVGQITTVNAPKVFTDINRPEACFKRTNKEYNNQVFQGYALKRQKGDTIEVLELLKYVLCNVHICCALLDHDTGVIKF